MNTQQKKVLNFLNELYDLTKDDYTSISLKNIINKHNLGNSYSVILRDNLLEHKPLPQNTSLFTYKWKSIKPNLKMVERVIKEVSDYTKASQSKNKSKKENYLTNGNAKNRLAFVKELRDVCLTKYAEMPTRSIITMRDKHNVDLNFTNFIFNNKYFSRKISYNNEVGVICYVYRWNTCKSYTQLKKLILEADNNVVELIKKIDNKQKVEKLEPIKEIKKDTHREKVIKEYRDKSIIILWGLIKIKY